MNNGNTDEKIFTDKITVKAVKPASDLKGISYFGSTGYSRLTNVARGDTYTYRVELAAYGAAVSGGVVYEAFPDSGIGSRSRLNAQITNPNPTRYRIEYCTKAGMPADPVQGVKDAACDNNWMTTVADYKQVTAYRIKVQNGQSIPVGEAKA